MHKRSSGEQGAALLEFAMVMVLLFVLLFGIITFGYMMSFRQSMTQSAAEGARAAASAPRPRAGAVYDNSIALTRAREATAQAVSGFGRSCNAGGLTCTWEILDCNGSADTPATPDCMTVTLSYDYAGHPLLPEFPLVSAAVPNTLAATSVVQLNAE